MPFLRRRPADKAAEAKLRAVRLKHLQLVHGLRDLERQIRSKETLDEGLHLIDFEQLKIENTNLNEKIEERNEDLAKLKKKITSTVQVRGAGGRFCCAWFLSCVTSCCNSGQFDLVGVQQWLGRGSQACLVAAL